MDSQRSVAAAEVSSVMVPLPVASEIMLDIGPKQIMFTITTSTSRNAIQLCARTNFFFGFAILRTATVITIAATRTIASTIRYGLQVLRTLITSSMLIANIFSSSLGYFLCMVLGNPFPDHANAV